MKVFTVSLEVFNISYSPVYTHLQWLLLIRTGRWDALDYIRFHNYPRLDNKHLHLFVAIMCDMSRDSEPASRSATLVEAGEILQKLSPSRFATLLFASDDDIETQAEIADILGISPSTVSTYLQSFEDTPVALTNRGHQYNVTPAGNTIIELLNSMFGYLGEDLSTIDWEDEDDRERIGELLSPLHSSRSTVPFFVLYSIGRRSAVEGRLDRFVSPQSVQFKDVIADVKKWQEERGKSGTRQQVRWMLNRFEECGMIEFDGETIKLIEKGPEHVRLLDQLIDLLEEDDASESSEETSSISSPSTQQSTGIQSELSTESATDRAGLQLGLQSFSSEQEDADCSELSTLVPAYCVSSSDSEREGPRSSSTVMPLTPTTTVEDLADQIHRIGREHGNVQLELFWTELPAESSDADSSGQSQLQR